MATTEAQRKWRDKNRLVKRQLNVMAGRLVHRYLDEVALAFGLRGKGEAVAFSCFVAKALMQRADYDDGVRSMLAGLAETYHRDREIYAGPAGRRADEDDE